MNASEKPKTLFDLGALIASDPRLNLFGMIVDHLMTGESIRAVSGYRQVSRTFNRSILDRLALTPTDASRKFPTLSDTCLANKRYLLLLIKEARCEEALKAVEHLKKFNFYSIATINKLIKDIKHIQRILAENPAASMNLPDNVSVVQFALDNTKITDFDIGYCSNIVTLFQGISDELNQRTVDQALEYLTNLH